MINAYLDESGIHGGAKVCVIAGFFGKKGGWRTLESNWRGILKRFNMPLEEFRAKVVVPRRANQDLVISLASAIAESRIYPVSCGLFVDDFFRFSLNERRFMTGATWNAQKGKFTSSGCPSKPYFVPFQEVLRRVSLHTPPTAKAHFFFGSDRPFSEYALSYFRHLKWRAERFPQARRYTRFGNIDFPEAQDTPHLQAADLFSYLTYQHMLERGNTGDWISSPSSAAILKMLQKRKAQEDTVFFTESTIRETFALASVPLPK